MNLLPAISTVAGLFMSMSMFVTSSQTSFHGKAKSASPIPDLYEGMYVDPETLTKIFSLYSAIKGDVDSFDCERKQIFTDTGLQEPVPMDVTSSGSQLETSSARPESDSKQPSDAFDGYASPNYVPVKREHLQCLELLLEDLRKNQCYEDDLVPKYTKRKRLDDLNDLNPIEIWSVSEDSVDESEENGRDKSGDEESESDDSESDESKYKTGDNVTSSEVTVTVVRNKKKSSYKE